MPHQETYGNVLMSLFLTSNWWSIEDYAQKPQNQCGRDDEGPGEDKFKHLFILMSESLRKSQSFTVSFRTKITEFMILKNFFFSFLLC